MTKNGMGNGRGKEMKGKGDGRKGFFYSSIFRPIILVPYPASGVNPFFTRDSVCYSAYILRQFRPSVCLSVTRVDWLGSVVVERRTSDRKIASSTPGRRIVG